MNDNNQIQEPVRIWRLVLCEYKRGKLVSKSKISAYKDVHGVEESIIHRIKAHCHFHKIKDVAVSLFFESDLYAYHHVVHVAKQYKCKAPKTYVEYVCELIERKPVTPQLPINDDIPF